MLVADTSALYALLDRTDAHHAKALAEARRERTFLIPSEILGEVLGLVRHRIGAEEGRITLEAIKRMPHARVAATRQPVVDQALSAASTSSRLSYLDWIVVHTCRTLGAQPWTYDDDIRRAVKA